MTKIDNEGWKVSSTDSQSHTIRAWIAQNENFSRLLRFLVVICCLFLSSFFFRNPAEDDFHFPFSSHLMFLLRWLTSLECKLRKYANNLFSIFMKISEVQHLFCVVKKDDDKKKLTDGDTERWKKVEKN